MATVQHARIRSGVLEDRLYQKAIAETATSANTLVVLPTGLGKTAIALRVMAEYLERRPSSSLLLMAPTRPLVLQHAKSVADALVGPEPIVLTGAISPERRMSMLHPPQVIVATPQVIGNDLAHGEFPLSTLSLVVFDEAHRAVGDYPYVAIGRELRAHPSRILAMTASPGSRIDRVRAVWQNLGIERFEFRTVWDADVQPYVHTVAVEPVSVPVPVDVQYLAIHLKTAVRRQTSELIEHGWLPAQEVQRRDLLALGERLRREIDVYRQQGTTAPGALWAAMTAHAVAMKEMHALELIETQGVEALRQFLERQAPGPARRTTPSERAFLADPDVERVREALRSISVEHPKIETAVRIVTEELGRAPQSRVIVFAHFRQTAEVLVEEFRRRQGPVRAVRFVGQASHGSDTGLSQKEQAEILDRFRSGEVNCLVATSVAEEGLDIPSTDLVVLYEPVPDEIRTIQRRGRTGRARAGRAVVLIAAGTRDEGMFRAARTKEKRMQEMLLRVQEEARGGTLPPPVSPTRQRMLTEYPSSS